MGWHRLGSRWEGDREGLQAAMGAELFEETLNVVAHSLGLDAERQGHAYGALTGRQPAKNLPFPSAEWKRRGNVRRRIQQGFGWCT